MVVHHGGAGTTGAALRAGVPAIVVPHTADQPFWAQRLHYLGVAPPPLPARRLTAGKLAEAIRHVATNPALAQRASEIGEKIRREDGVGQAADLIERHYRDHNPSLTIKKRRL